MSDFGFFVFWEGMGLKNHAGAFSVVLSAKSKYISAKQKFFLSNPRLLCQSIGPHFKEIVVI